MTAEGDAPDTGTLKRELEEPQASIKGLPPPPLPPPIIKSRLDPAKDVSAAPIPFGGVRAPGGVEDVDSAAPFRAEIPAWTKLGLRLTMRPCSTPDGVSDQTGGQSEILAVNPLL